MSYKALYRTYRPMTFDEVAGQKHIVQTLKNALRENKIAHAYLFCGPRGTGKTTMARIFAKALNCENEFGNPNVSSAYIADKCGVSINYVLRIFKKMSGGTSLNAYLSMLRLDNAEKLLRNTTLNINEIAEKSGFFSISTFNRLFKKEYLLTPQQYRKNVYK